jgi:hypothetical protein
MIHTIFFNVHAIVVYEHYWKDALLNHVLVILLTPLGDIWKTPRKEHIISAVLNSDLKGIHLASGSYPQLTTNHIIDNLCVNHMAIRQVESILNDMNTLVLGYVLRAHARNTGASYKL